MATIVNFIDAANKLAANGFCPTCHDTTIFTHEHDGESEEYVECHVCNFSAENMDDYTTYIYNYLKEFFDENNIDEDILSDPYFSELDLM